MNLLARQSLIKTGPVDEADWVYRPFVGFISRMRFHLIVNLLRGSKPDRLLEIGYGSGVFLPELARHANELHGIDIHEMPRQVQQALAEAGTEAQLHTAGAESIPYPDGFFDCAVAVSALEFVSDLDRVCAEIRRVLKPNGYFLFITPGTSPLLDFGLKLLTGNDAGKDFGNRREIVVPTAAKHFRLERTISAPPLIGAAIRLYLGVRCAI